jgi:hypothetical protein
LLSIITTLRTFKLNYQPILNIKIELPAYTQCQREKVNLRENSSSLTTIAIERNAPPLLGTWGKVFIDKVSPVLDVIVLIPYL